MPDENISKVEMTQIRLIKSVFRVNTDLPPAPEEERIAVVVALKNNGEFVEDGSRATFLQSLKTTEDLSVPFALEVEFAAVFELDPGPLPLQWPHYVRHVFPRLVFPFLRDHVAETTGKGGFTPLVINQDIFDDELERSAATVNGQWVH